MSYIENEELDISASFTVEAGVSSETLTAAVKELVGEEDFQKRLRRANDEGEWFEIGSGSMYRTKQYIVLGDDGFIKDGVIYQRVTVKFRPGSKSGREYTLTYPNFGSSVLNEIRIIRDKLKQKLVPKRSRRRSKLRP